MPLPEENELPEPVSDMIEAHLAGARQASATFLETVELAAAALERLERDGKGEDGSGEERMAALRLHAAALEAALLELVFATEAAMDGFMSDFERIRRSEVERARSPFLRRNRPLVVVSDHRALAALADEIEGGFAHIEAVLDMLEGEKATLRRCHAQADAVVERAIERRRTALTDLEAARRRAGELRLPLTEAVLLLSTADEGDRAALSRERERRQAALDEARTDEAGCFALYEARDHLAALSVHYTDALNAGLAARTLLSEKLTIELQRGVLLHRAVIAGGEADTVSTAVGPVATMRALAQQGILTHAETMRRKAAIDDALARRFGAVSGPRSRA
ncbi:hypothetical protein NOF55_05840 [Rhizobiaceae bacterium BDR2-2]|uniref:Uncharacterized protein n=1 Tax=Ectorhizobium quercum TaxID=2965071 RepID=A0AAE3SU33_9HYPH|nr:hypothetical protein [Ectorhizobium quercum]MCX8996622.1 hypothetical protein [Ectorhizobium quercum]